MEILDVFPPDGRGARKKHDFDTLCDGKIRRLNRGKDFNCLPASIRSQFVRHAERRGMSGRTCIDGDSITLQAYRKDK
jgi:hypothetical protein